MTSQVFSAVLICNLGGLIVRSWTHWRMKNRILTWNQYDLDAASKILPHIKQISGEIFDNLFKKDNSRTPTIGNPYNLIECIKVDDGSGETLSFSSRLIF